MVRCTIFRIIVLENTLTNPMNRVSLRVLFFFSLALIVASGCKKDEIIIDDNTAPPDSTISTLIVENYVTKCYISLLGREPNAQEETDAIATLKNGNMSVASRKLVLDEILLFPEYRTKVLEYNSIKLLNGLLDVAVLQEQIDTYTFIQQQPEYAYLYDEIQAIIDNLVVLRDTPTAFVDGDFGMQEMHRRLVSNDIYDQINMGSFNFVLSMFNNFLYRDPTGDEHESGITMVDGFVAVLFYETANSKEDFIDIFLGSDDYFEGQVRELCARYLFREPTSAEQGYHSVRYRESGNYERLQKDILSTDEFAGL
tara:strand:+ start:59 stop:994 length:936 start_codon:yes stop_codon:yes gene_type:complete